MASAVISSILSSGANLLFQLRNTSVKLRFSHDQQALETDLQKLTRTLERIKATLLDAEEREVRDRSVKLWLKELKQVAYAAEDLFDELWYEVLRNRVVEMEGRNGSSLISVVSGPVRKDFDQVSCLSPDFSFSYKCMIDEGVNVVDRIREIGVRFDEIAKDRDALQLREDDGVKRVRYERVPPPTSHFVDESSVFGREEEKESLISLLLAERHEASPLSVISIVGKGGLGKTTLAQIAFNDPRVSENFDLFGWVCVLEDFDVKGLTQFIYEALTGGGCDSTELSALQNLLCEEVRGKNVLLVLDDVWNESERHWEALRSPLMNAKMVKILVTTRNATVSRVMQSVFDFRLGYLNKEQSWLLFQHHAFHNASYGEKSSFGNIGRQIVSKCGGLPLAIRSLASLLKYEEDYDNLEEILQSDLWESHANNEIFAALEISYMRMPTHLKPCFLFCSMYPKDYIFKKDQLIGLWIAQGYVEKPKGSRKTLEEIGLGYLEELIQRSFIDSSNNANNAFPSDQASYVEANIVLKLHDVIHDLARLISGNEHLSLDGNDVDNYNLGNQVYHLYSSSFSGLLQPLNTGQLVSLRTLVLGLTIKNTMQINEVTKAKGLRAFEIKEGGPSIQLPDSIGNLKHLRYLYVSLCEFQNLPESICLLYNLQSLTLFDCSNLVSLPEGIENLVNLRYLDIRYSKIKNLPDSITLLNNLETLILCSLEINEVPEGIGNLVNLRHLSFAGCPITKLPESISHLKYLNSMSLTNCYEILDLPIGMTKLKKLKTLNLIGTGIRYVPPSINELTFLEKFNASLIVERSNKYGTIGLLKDLVFLKGGLGITGLINIVNLEDASFANLKDKQNITNLTLSWWPIILTKYDGLNLIIEGCDGFNLIIEGDDLDNIEYGLHLHKKSATDFPLLEILQPHPNLKELTILGYRAQALPKWLGDASCCALIESISIRSSYYLKSLNFHTLFSLKSPTITQCDQLQFLPQQNFPPKLEYLWIQHCSGLLSLDGLQNFEYLEKLYILQCKELVIIEGLPNAISVLHVGKCEKLKSVQKVKFSCLKYLEISKCPLLEVSADELAPKANCVVRVSDCPMLTEWCMKHGIDSSLEADSAEDQWETWPSPSLPIKELR